MKKFLRGLVITLVVLIILPICLVFVFFFDTGKMKVDTDENFTKEEWTKSLVVDSLDYTESEKLARFSISENDINSLIYSATKDNTELSKYLTQLAVDIQDDCYVLNVSGKFNFFETRAKLTAKLTKEEISYQGHKEEAFVLTVEKMSLGRLTKLKKVITYVLNKFIDNKTVDALTSSLKLHSDLENFKFFIFTSDLRAMINEAMNNGGSGESDFYFAFVNDFLDKGLINLDFYGGESLTVDINLEPLTGNDYGAGENVYYPMPYDSTLTKLTINGEQKKLSLNTIREALVSLLNDGIINQNNLTMVSDFLFQGNQGDNVPAANLSSIGIPVKETYQGFNLVDAASMDDTLKNAISTFPGYSDSINSFDIAEIKESDINLFLKTQSVFGNKYFLERELKEGGHKISYVALDNAYLNLYGNYAIISVGLNINGLETMVTLKMELDTSNTDRQKLVYNPAKVYFGAESANLELSSDSKALVFDTLYRSVNQSSFKFDRNGKMTISFNTLIGQAINNIDTGDPIKNDLYKNFLRNNADISISVEGNAVTDNSKVIIQAVRR